MKVKIINRSAHAIPTYKTEAAAGMDLCANLESPLVLSALERAVVGTGIYIELPVGYEAQVRPRSGLAAKHGISVLNAPGTIDADYRGEIGVILINLSKDEYLVENGARIAQLVFSQFTKAELQLVESLSESIRGNKGFGSTGV